MGKIKYTTLFGILLLSVSLLVVGIGTVHAQGENSTQALPRLSTYENKLVDEDNNIVTLRGVAVHDPCHLELSGYDPPFENIFAELSSWNINVVRVPIHPGLWKAVENYAQEYLDPLIELGKKYGFYVILDWHAIGDPLTGVALDEVWEQSWVETESGWIQVLGILGDAARPVYDSSLELAKSAWMKLAGRYGENSWVIFELFNEPITWGEEPDNWEGWRDSLQVLIDNIRTVAPNTLILVSGWQWTHDLRGFENYPVERDNIAYVGHMYPENSYYGKWENFFGFMSKSHPVIVTEWGFDPTLGPGCTREEFGQLFLRYMESKDMSWTAWCFSPEWGARSMIKNWNFELGEEGLLIKQALTPDNTPPTISIRTPSDGATVDETVTIEGTASEDVGLLTVEVRIDNDSYQPALNVFDHSYCSDNWSYSWDTGTVPDGTHTITARVINASCNTSTVSITVNVMLQLGDVNGDGDINIIDALQVARYAASLNPSPFNASVADVTGDGNINIVDALQIARYDAGLITEFPPPPPT